MAFPHVFDMQFNSIFLLYFFFDLNQGENIDLRFRPIFSAAIFLVVAIAMPIRWRKGTPPAPRKNSFHLEQNSTSGFAARFSACTSGTSVARTHARQCRLHLGDATRNAKVERVARNPSRTATRNFLFHWNKIRRRPLRRPQRGAARPTQKLWRGRTTYSEVFETARDARKATTEVACGCELDFDRLSRAVGSG